MTGNPNWMSPAWLVEAAREVLDGIDLDPCSSEEANKIVKARAIVTCDGEETHWGWPAFPKSVYINPPGNLVKAFWITLHQEIPFSCITHAIWVGFNIGQLRSLRDPSPLRYPICIPNKRIKFIDESGVGKNPMYDNFIAYIPGTECEIDRFCNVFGKFGVVKR